MDPGALIGPAQGPLGAFRGVFAPTGPVYGPIGAPARGIPSEINQQAMTAGAERLRGA